MWTNFKGLYHFLVSDFIQVFIQSLSMKITNGINHLFSIENHFHLVLFFLQKLVKDTSHFTIKI